MSQDCGIAMLLTQLNAPIKIIQPGKGKAGKRQEFDILTGQIYEKEIQFSCSTDQNRRDNHFDRFPTCGLSIQERKSLLLLYSSKWP